MLIPCPETDTRRACRLLYWTGWDIPSLSREFGRPLTTLHSWRTRDGWDKAPVIARIEAATEARYMQLVLKDKKTPHDFKEIDLLGRQLERHARINRFLEPGGNEAHLNPNVENRNKGEKKRKPANFFTEAQIEQLERNYQDRMFRYQLRWKEALLTARIRNILKSRQIGATYAIAFESLIDALKTGKNKLFISASKAQAYAFRAYIVDFAREVGVELKGDPITLGNNGARLYFLATNFRVTQGFSGDLIFDEYQWTANFLKIRHTAAGMAAQKRFTQTYITTPSSTTHDGWSLWSGDHWNSKRPAGERVVIDISHDALREGALGPDRQWRNIVTLEDALADGCDLFDIDDIRAENSPDEYANKFGCQPIDDTASVFPFAELQPCMVDSWEEWLDLKPFAPRPLGNRPVWIGYDPAKSGDGAAIVVIAAPQTPLSPFRIVEREMFKGMDYTVQVEHIRRLTERYNVVHIGMDTNAVGASVIEAVRTFFPTVVGDTYTPAVKTAMVYKAKEVIMARRLQFDRGWQDVAHAFMAIRKGITASGRHITFYSQRSESIGHADVAWATMHALRNEPLTAVGDHGKAQVEIFS
ncbi:terminase large subunit domain-containing protein [Lysobacter brunescens]|uniref:Terminase large subunit domain-containing protein n=1 Tax=Lysobacter brunescens TaxID=262323 RepID=A0ABW2YF00_9GAMM